MPTTGSLKDYNESLLDLAWSLWTELGVSGWVRNHAHWVLDPEELLVFTAFLGDLDARLREECIDWCIRSGDVLSVDRLKNLLKASDDGVKASFGEIASIVRKHKGPKLPHPRPTKRNLEPSRKSERPALRRPALLVLRFRKIFGVGVKAELMSRFVLSPHRLYTINEFVEEGIGFARVTVSQALDDLVEAHAVELDRSQRDGHFQLGARRSLLEALDLGLGWRPRWDKLFELLRLGKRLFTPSSGKDSKVEALDAAELQRDIAACASALGLDQSNRDTSSVLAPALLGAIGLAAGGSYLNAERHEALRTWFSELVEQLSRGAYPGQGVGLRLDKAEFITYTVLRSIRAQVTHLHGYSPQYGTDEFLRALAVRRPRTAEEARMLAGSEFDIDQAILEAYLAEIRREER